MYVTMKLLYISIYLLHIFLLSSAKPGFNGSEQEWGYVTVREGAHMFWWLYYTTANVPNPTDRPLVIWLQGGPGGSSTGYGNFGEIGPLDLDLQPRNTSWVQDVNVLFIDNPVGTGFSYVDDPEYLTTTNRQIALDFVELMEGFYEELPKFKNVPLYIFCESYGGKMAAEIALLIYNEAKAGRLDCQLKGVGLGDSWIAPIEIMMEWGPYLYNIGAVDEKGRQDIVQDVQKAKAAMAKKYYFEAQKYYSLAQYTVSHRAGVDFYNVLDPSPGTKIRVMKEKISSIMKNHVGKELNTTKDWGWSNSITNDYRGEVFHRLKADFMIPVVDIVEDLLNSTDVYVAVYNGQLDLIVDTPGVLDWVTKMSWKGKEGWNAAERVAFKDHEGYVKKHGNFAFYWVNRAGHMVPVDNPSAMHHILRDVTNNFKV